MAQRHRVWVNLKDGSRVQSQLMSENQAQFELQRLNTAMNFASMKIGGPDHVIPVGTTSTVRSADIVAAGVEEEQK